MCPFLIEMERYLQKLIYLIFCSKISTTLVLHKSLTNGEHIQRTKDNNTTKIPSVLEIKKKGFKGLGLNNQIYNDMN